MKGRITEDVPAAPAWPSHAPWAPRDGAGFVLGNQELWRGPRTKSGLGKQVKTSLPSEGEGLTSSLLDACSALSFKDASGGASLTDPESRAFMPCPSPCPQETALIRKSRNLPPLSNVRALQLILSEALSAKALW